MNIKSIKYRVCVQVKRKKINPRLLGEPETLRNLSNGCMAAETERKHEHNVVKILPQGQKPDTQDDTRQNVPNPKELTVLGLVSPSDMTP